MKIYEYKPNGRGPDEYFEYSGSLQSMMKITENNDDEKIHGWFVSSRVLFRKNFNAVIFAHKGEIFIHIEEGVFNITTGQMNISFKKLPCVLFITFNIEGAIAINKRIYIPIHRYFSNDGMFPDEIEPFYDIFNRLSNPKEQLKIATMLSSGIGVGRRQ